MKANDLIEALTILKPYYEDDDAQFIEVEDDGIYASPTDRVMADEDINKMISLGWFQDPCSEYEFALEHYDVSESWAGFT